MVWPWHALRVSTRSHAYLLVSTRPSRHWVSGRGLSWVYLVRPLSPPVAQWQSIGRRDFGLGRPIQRFGHSHRPPPRGELVLVGLGMLWLVILVMDWDRLHKDFGFKLPFFGNILLSPKSLQHEDTKNWSDFLDNEDIPEGELSILEKAIFDERRDDIHKFLREQLQERKKFVDELPLEEQVKARNDDFLLLIEREDVLKARIKAESKGSWPQMFGLKAEEAELEAIESEEDHQDEAYGGQGSKVGFRNRKIIEYENRVRQYSTPDKIFRYFATYKVVDDKGHSEVMMTPEDFLRSITPGIQQPENLGLDQFHSIALEELDGSNLNLGVAESSIFHHLGSGGLISFSDYIFLLTVLSTSRRHFQIAFKMFDLNGDGNVDAKEFEVVTNLMKSQSSMGARHRDHQTTGSTFKGINSGLITYFFGSNREEILTVDKFLHFQRHLQNEILALEFKRKMGGNSSTSDRLTEKDFADLLIAYAGFSPKKKTRMLKRVRKEFHHSESPGVSLSDYLNFYQVLYCINDIDTALTFYHIAGAPIERETMKHVAKTVANVELSDHMINVVFVLFDENGDGKLSNKEFVSVMKQRAMRGLEKPKDTGIGRVLSAITKCASDTRPTILGGMRKTE